MHVWDSRIIGVLHWSTPWSTFGVRLGHFWGTFGVLLEYFLGNFGVLLEYFEALLESIMSSWHDLVNNA